VDDYLPTALLHLREADIVRLCGLARAARGQGYARTGQVRQAERVAGTLRAAVLEGAAPRLALARFADLGLDAWECACSPAPDLASAAPGAQMPCAHVAALLYLWVRDPGQFHVSGASPEPAPTPIAQDEQARARRQGAELSPAQQPEPDSATPFPDSAPAAPDTPAPLPLTARLEQLDPVARRFLNLLALAEGGVTESEAQRLFSRLGLGAPEEALSALERLRLGGLAQPVFISANPSGRVASSADSSAGWAIPEAVLAHLSRELPLLPLVESGGEDAPGQPEPALPLAEGLEELPPDGGLREQRAPEDLPALLFVLVAQMVDRTAPVLGPAPAQKPASRSTYDLDAALAQRWAQPLDAAPEQLRFGLALLRLLGFAPQPAPAEGVRPAVSSAGARETLLRAYRLLLGRPSAEVLPDLFQHWLHAHSARELVDLRDAGVRVASLSQRETRRALDIAAENQSARQMLVNLLRWAPVGRWWSFGSLVEFLWRFQPGFLRGHQQTFLRPQWWLERLPDGEPLSLDARADWRQGEGRYLALLMRRALHWLGVVDLALDAQGRLQGFRLTPTGAFLLGAAPGALAEEMRVLPPSLPATGSEQWAANQLAGALQPLEAGALLAPLAALREETLDLLLWWCEPAGATGVGLRFLPSAERTAAALDAGQEMEAWLAWLEQAPQDASLSALVAQWRRWAAMYGQARVDESATLLEVADPALLRELEVTLNLSEQFIDHLLAPGLVVVRPDAAEALVSELRRRGYAPWVSND